MKCPKCSYTSFNYLENCKRCGAPLNPKAFYGHQIYKSKLEGKNIVADSEEAATGFDDAEYEKAVESEKPRKVLKEDKIFEEPNIFLQKDQFQDVFDKLKEKGGELPEQSDDTHVLEEKTGFVDRIKYLFVNGSHTRESVNEDDYTVVIDNLASIRSRTAAFIIDWTIVLSITLLVFIAGLRQIDIDYSYDPSTLFSILVKVFLLLLFFASTYFLFLTGYSGKTIGKLLLGLEVVNKDGSKVGLYESAKRWFVSVISLPPLFLGYFPVFFSDEKQCFHDKIANTIVVKSTEHYDS